MTNGKQSTTRGGARRRAYAAGLVLGLVLGLIGAVILDLSWPVSFGLVILVSVGFFVVAERNRGGDADRTS
jgi:hypothetical protein